MNSLMSYGSDDDSNESADPKYLEMPGRQNVLGSKSYRKPAAHEDNYEEVGMDMSEDSDDSRGPATRNREEPRQNQHPHVKSDHRQDHSFEKRTGYPPTSGHGSHSRPNERRSSSRSPKSRKEEDRRPNRPEDRNREDRYRGEDKYRRRDERGSTGSRDSKDEDRSKERSVRDDDKGKDRSKDDRRDNRKYSRDRRDRDRDRKRSRSRDRRRSRSPRKTSRSPRRSRSGSKDKGSKPFLSRREKADKRMDRLDKLGIQFKPDNYPASAIQEAETKSNSNGNRFFMPGITGRFREQIEKRKQLWQKGKEPEVAGPSSSALATLPAGGSKATKVYEATTFSDDKTSNKFKRLMGIKETDAETLPVKATDVLKKQQEMFSSMEAQYEVARTATHTMRGVGLGFGSFQR